MFVKLKNHLKSMPKMKKDLDEKVGNGQIETDWKVF